MRRNLVNDITEKTYRSTESKEIKKKKTENESRESELKFLLIPFFLGNPVFLEA